MKKNFVCFLSFAFFVTLISGCKVDPQRYKDACKAGDFETAHQVLDEIFNEFEDVWDDNLSDMSRSDREECEAAATKYSRAASYVLSAEARYLISNNEEEAVDRLAYLLEEIPVMGEKVPEGTEYHDMGFSGYQIVCAKFDCYKQTVKVNNELCNTILNLAIKNGNEKLAKLALSHYLDNGILYKDEEGFGDDKVSWSYDDELAANGKYNEAVASGAFK